MKWLFASFAHFSKGMLIFLCKKLLTARLKVNRAPVEVCDAARAHLGWHIKEDFLKAVLFI